MKRLAVFVVSMLSLQLAVPPAGARITDPPHSQWMVDLYDKDNRIGLDESLQLTGFSSFSPPDPIPEPGYVFFPRKYDMVFPAGFQVTDTYIYSGQCTTAGNTAHCEAGFGIYAGGGDSLTLIAQANTPPGVYQATLTTTALIGGTEYTDSASVNITILPRRTADIVVEGPAENTVIQAGQRTDLTYRVTNNGPDVARDVYLFYRFGQPVSVTSGATCQTERTECFWGTIAPGATKTVVFSMNYVPNPRVPDDYFEASVLVNSYETDPDPGNNYTPGGYLRTRCTYYIDPTAKVDRMAKVAPNGCTFIGPRTVVGRNAEIGEGAHVVGASDFVDGPGSVVGDGAKIGAGSVYDGVGDPLAAVPEVGKMGPRASLGTGTFFRGEIGDNASVGDGVWASISEARWTIVGSKATIGSGTKIELSRPWEQRLRIFSGAKIPANTIINDSYCLGLPKVCQLY